MSGNLLRIIMLGAPASGKGTLSKCIVQKYDCLHISPGDILRLNMAEKTKLGETVSKYMEKGALVPDDVVMQCVLERLLEAHRSSWILDGFPRTLPQAKLLHSSICEAVIVFNLLVPDAILMERVRNRWIHLQSGRVYNKDFNVPKIMWKDDETGEDLVQRIDDAPAVVKQRLVVYRKAMREVLEYYRSQGIDVVNLEGDATHKFWPRVEHYLTKRIQIMAKS